MPSIVQTSLHLSNARSVRLTLRRFFRVFCPRERHIRIHAWFERRWGDYIEGDVILQDLAKNRLWMHVYVREDGMNLCREVEDLRIFYDVAGVWLMTFTLVSSNLFKIRIFGPDSVEIQYPPVVGR
ncbi:hypothetical protein SESBI_16944 [Sesbania bispinosa]|nr:hypothetical protein SESBI_16944 [Sesbania bispinosa]